MTLRTNEIESLADFDATILGTTDLNGWFVQSVDLTERGPVLRAVDVAGSVFLGCTFSAGTEASLRDRGAMIFPALPHLPFDAYRARLYDADELYSSPEGVSLLEGAPYQECLDAQVYAWTRRAHLQHTLEASLATSLHDHAITDALDEATSEIPSSTVVGVMGGHALRRGETDYRVAVELGARLRQIGRTVLTGGGPGAMEAANLGAYLSGHAAGAELDRIVDDAVAMLAEHPDFHADLDAWAAAALRVRHRWSPAGAGHSIGIPTWFYGHEPPNLFATEIAKYFTNALREDTLLSRCRGGIIYLPGAAGTVQEVFQAVTENYYAAHDDAVCPMVLVGVDHWTRTLPVWPLLQALGDGRTMGTRIHCVDSVAEAIEVFTTAG